MTQTARWRLSVNIGRERGTWMPEEWAASGGRLVLPVEVNVTSDAVVDDFKRDSFVGPSSFRVVPVGKSSFVGAGGTTNVTVRSGGWHVTPPKRGERPALLRLWLEFPFGASRGDVTLPAERVYFSAPVWQAVELAEGRRALESARERLSVAQAELDLSNAAEAEASILRRGLGIRRKVQLIERRDGIAARCKTIENLRTAGATARSRFGIRKRLRFETRVG